MQMQAHIGLLYFVTEVKVFISIVLVLNMFLMKLKNLLGIKTFFECKQTFFFLYIQFTLFQTKNLQSPGTYISKRTWDPGQKAITKQTDSQLKNNWM